MTLLHLFLYKIAKERHCPSPLEGPVYIIILHNSEINSEYVDAAPLSSDCANPDPFIPVDSSISSDSFLINISLCQIPKMRRHRHQKKKEKDKENQDEQLPVVYWSWIPAAEKEALLNCAYHLAKANSSDMIRKAKELPGVECGFAAQVACAQQDPKHYRDLKPLLEIPPRKLCGFCKRHVHKISDCKCLAKVQCGVCGEIGHRSNFCLRPTWPEVVECCETVCREFPGFVWHTAFRRALAIHDLPLFCQAVSLRNGVGTWHLEKLTHVRNREFRDACYQHLLPRIWDRSLQQFADWLVAQTRVLRLPRSRRRDLFYIFVDCLSHGAKAPAGTSKLWTKGLLKIYQGRLLLEGSQWLLPPLWPTIAEYAVSGMDFTK
jgi:hypothetical protein